MARINFRIVTPERVVYTNDIDQVTIPTQSGEVTVLPNHIPLVSLLKAGEMMLKRDGDEQLFAVSTGFVEVRPHSEVVILADTAERADEIDLERATEARERAQKALLEKRDMDDVQFAKFQAILDKEVVRIKVRNKHRSRHQLGK